MECGARARRYPVAARALTLRLAQERPTAAPVLAADGEEAWAQVLERGYEGYVAKNEASMYEGGAPRGG